MDVSPNRREQRSSILLKGLGAGLTQWDDLKSWQVRQEALFIQSSPSKSQDGQSPSPDGKNGQTFGANLISLLMQTRNFALDGRPNVTENAKGIGEQCEVRQPATTDTNGVHHDLSIIPELDEDSRTTVELGSSDEETTPTPSPRPSPRLRQIPKLPLSIPPLRVQTKPEMQRERAPEIRPAKPPENKEPSQKPAENKRPTRPFLRRGQGLVRFNLRPEDALKPYQTGTKNPPRIIKPVKKPPQPSRKLPKPVDCPIALSSLKLRKDVPKTSQPVGAQPTGLATQPNGFVNQSNGFASQPTGFATWSHLLAQDENSEDEEEDRVAGLAGVRRMQDNAARHTLLGSPKRTGTLRDGRRVFEDDEESLAAYVALEQQIGDTSFCSTSSTVDRLVAKSARLNSAESPRRQHSLLQTRIHEEEPSRVRQANENRDNAGDWRAEEEELKRRMAQLTTGRMNIQKKNPVHDDSLGDWEAEEEELKWKTAQRTAGRMNVQKKNPVHDDSLGDWEAEEEELKRKTAQRTAGRINNQKKNPVQEDSSGDWEAEEEELKRKTAQRTAGRMNNQKKNPVHDDSLGDWEAEEEELKRKTAQLTAGRMNVQKKNPVQEDSLGDWEAEEEELKRKKMAHLTTGRISVVQIDDDESPSESGSESEDDSESSEEEDSMVSAVPRNPVKITDFAPINNPCDSSTASIDLVIENINRKVEEHLSRLCFEIETLQKSNASAKNQVKSLKKQVRKLEQKLATEHLAYERKLAEQREDSAKVLAEEKAKTAKEKANLERFCREQKKKEPSPVLIEQVERLRSDMVAKEEKWRAERAKARGLECNLRIQITNLRQENEKLKNENSKLKREKETAINAAKAKNVSNTKVINAIAQHLSKAKPQVTVTKEKNAPSGKVPPQNKATSQTKAPSPNTEVLSRQPTIGVFPTAGNGSASPKEDEWLSSDDEIDLPKTPDKFDENLSKAMSNGAVTGIGDCVPVPTETDSLTESVLAETEARYNALFENRDGGDVQTTKRANSDSGNNVIVHPDGSIERRKSSGGSVLTLPDGTQRRQGRNGSVMTVPPSGWPILVTYFNGDKLERHEDGTVRYFYAKTQAWQITHPDGREELLLPNGVVGDKRGDGSLTVTIPDTAESKTTRGRGSSKEPIPVASTKASPLASTAETVVLLPNGEQEIRTKDYVERRFQDGTVRYLYNDGMQKTIYKSGRIRVKDKDGKLLMDSASCERR